MTDRRANERAGFTLVELLIVLAIIGILAGLIGVNLTTVRAKARDNQRQSDLGALAVALENYRSDNKRYPDQAGGFTDANVLTAALVSRYISSVPQDPRAPDTSYRYATNALMMSDGAAPASPKVAGSLFALDAVLEQAASELPSLSPQIVVNDNSKLGFFIGGFYADGGQAHFRVVSR